MRLFNKILNLGKSDYSTVKLKNTNLSLIVGNDMLWCYSDNEYYEKKVLLILQAIIKKLDQKPILYDIGANSGYYSIMLSSLVSQVISFEPSKKSFDYLKKNIKLNKIKNIIPYDVALSDQNSEAELKIYNSSGNNSLFERSVPKDHPLKIISIEKVKLFKLDDFIQNEKKILKPNIIKIDVEGAEYPILNGAVDTLTKYLPTIILEYADSTANDAGYKKEQIITFLSNLGYHFYAVPAEKYQQNLTTMNNFDEFECENIVATKFNLNDLL